MRRDRLQGLFTAVLVAFATGSSLCAEAASTETPAESVKTDTVVGGVERGWLKREWRAYTERFVATDGRVIDNANGGVSHSEGQGYAMLIATFVDDASTFDKIWEWTKSHLQIRDDRLFAWRWDPVKGEVSDRNDASDGDLLIAWALARAANRFRRPELAGEARAIANSLGDTALVETEFGPTLAPATAGFGPNDQPDGPIFNPSYWVFPALAKIAELDPVHDWAGAGRAAFAILANSRFGDRHLPLDWESDRSGQIKQARNFSQAFGYDAIRIPLYLSWSDEPSARRELARFAEAWPAKGVGPSFRGGGYALIGELVKCASGKGEIDPDSLTQRDDLYYPATLRMLVLTVILERYPQCV